MWSEQRKSLTLAVCKRPGSGWAKSYSATAWNPVDGIEGGDQLGRWCHRPTPNSDYSVEASHAVTP